MRIKIKNNVFAKYSINYAEKLRKIDGQWVEVDTKYLFTDQFNTIPIEGITEFGMRIYAVDVEEIENDERIGRSKCGYCGCTAITGEPCPGCKNGKVYMVEFFHGTIRQPDMQEEVSRLLENISM